MGRISRKTPFSGSFFRVEESRCVYSLKPHVANGVWGYSSVLEQVPSALRHQVHDVVAGEVEP